MEEVEKLKSEGLKRSVGPCVRRLDEELLKMKVERQAYHGKSFVGNHVHNLLQVVKHNDYICEYVTINVDKTLCICIFWCVVRDNVKVSALFVILSRIFFYSVQTSFSCAIRYH